ncbi:MAG: TRAP transporter small permease [Treponema sp.]|nr:TRAP transporter small permease [Treponema sp.]
MNYKRVEKFLNFDYVVSCSALAVLIIVTFGAVIMRYFINRPIIWGEEVQLFCIVFVVFFGAGAGFRTGSHVAIDFLVDHFPPGPRKVIEFVIYAFSIIILAYFAVQSANFAAQMYRTRRTSEILDIPYFITYAAFPAGCVIMIVNYTLSVLIRLFGKGETE